jgi:hypothetical protein
MFAAPKCGADRSVYRQNADCRAPGATSGRPRAVPKNELITRERVVKLIVYYVVFMIIGDLAAYFVGLITERTFGSQASFIVFLTLYFLFLWVSWVLAVWLTEPKRNEPVPARSA